MRSTRLLLAATLLFAVACDPNSPVDILDVDGQLTTSRSTFAVGESVVAVLEAQGGYLLSLEMNWGDGSDPLVESIEGSRTARWTPDHTYAEPGTYTITGRIEEVRGTIARTVTITVTAAGAGARRASPGTALVGH
jgi:hypothetical protein